VARRLKVARNTIHRILERNRRATTGLVATLEALKPKRAPRSSKLDAFKDKIHALLTKFPDARPKKVHRILRGAGFTGGYTIVKDYLRKIAQKPAIEVVERFETDPGKQAQQDWSPYTLAFGTQQAFSYILGYSRTDGTAHDVASPLFPALAIDRRFSVSSLHRSRYRSLYRRGFRRASWTPVSNRRRSASSFLAATICVAL
jgi:transposase